MNRVATFVAGALVGVALGIVVSGSIYTPGGWMRAHPRPKFTTAPWEPAPDTTRSSDPVEHEIEGFRREYPRATKVEVEALRRVLRARATT